MRFILGEKLHMTQVWDDKGAVVPVTIVKVGPVTVTQVKSEERDGYSAVQVGFGDRKKQNVGKPLTGHMKGLGSFRYLKEFRFEKGDSYSLALKVGDKVDASVFKEGDLVVVSGTSKGKGFQGGVKRHGFKGGSRTHGQKHSEREPGAIGGGARAGGRVAKGMRMAGRMGGDRVTLNNVKIVRVDAEQNRLLVRGAVPGIRGTMVEIRSRN